MNRREFLVASGAAAIWYLIRNRMKTKAVASPHVLVPDPTPPTGQGGMTIPLYVGQPRDKHIFMPAIMRGQFDASASKEDRP